MRRRDFLFSGAALGLTTAAGAQKSFSDILMAAATQGGRVAEPNYFAKDVFSGSAADPLNAHTANIGGAWDGGTAFLLDGTGGIYNNAADTVMKGYLPATPPSADYYVQADFVLLSTLSAVENPGLLIRYDSAGDNGYWGYWNGVNRWIIARIDSGVPTTIASGGTTTFTSGTKTIKLSIAGNDIRLFINGVQTAQQNENTYSAAGKCGVRTTTAALGEQSATTGIHQTNFFAV